MKQKSLESPTAADLSGARSLAEAARMEGHSPADYAIKLADAIRMRKQPLSNQRERLQALARAGGGADRATADTLAQHHQVLEALFTRFAIEAAHWLESDKPNASVISERFLSAAIKAQVAAVRVLSALRTIREAPSPSPREGELGAPTRPVALSEAN